MVVTCKHHFRWLRDLWCFLAFHRVPGKRHSSGALVLFMIESLKCNESESRQAGNPESTAIVRLQPVALVHPFTALLVDRILSVGSIGQLPGNSFTRLFID